MTAVGYGLLIPFFFVTSGMNFDIDSLFRARRDAEAGDVRRPLPRRPRHPGAAALPQALDARERMALAFYSATELPLVVAITTLAMDAGEMKSSTAAGLVGAAIISASVFPLIALKLRSGASREPEPEAEPGAEPAPA